MSEKVNEAGGASPPLNVYQRKLRVMAALDIKPDKRHSLGFEYVSIQHLSNQLRTLCAKEGLDVEITFPDNDPGYIDIYLVNVDVPSDTIYTRWPVIEGDKGWAYTVKYPLVRLFLVGDPEENDEAEMAEKSGSAVKTPTPSSPPEPKFRGPRPPANQLMDWDIPKASAA